MSFMQNGTEYAEQQEEEVRTIKIAPECLRVCVPEKRHLLRAAFCAYSL